ncbi:hypothetical protein PCH_Pc22g02450 [Penicillium rubens Wisconsin 54-1255]|uniref:Uncharacterized protein n=1 Tax=Penicillium rubens (strain ATCC 28089 / DSM 1075 / NRRL 1951 / Wisconsin 54-1255) TaxID=500485 RepID=B6HPD6_PENRW|nr:hypothetical protein PCH_Pc22g02450 [Penicillium rubens Wisconsin 54-1255]
MDLETSHNAYALDPEAHRRSPPNKSRILERDQDMCRKLKHVEVMGVKLTSCTMSSDRMHVEIGNSARLRYASDSWRHPGRVMTSKLQVLNVRSASFVREGLGSSAWEAWEVGSC